MHIQLCMLLFFKVKTCWVPLTPGGFRGFLTLPAGFCAWGFGRSSRFCMLQQVLPSALGEEKYLLQTEAPTTKAMSSFFGFFSLTNTFPVFLLFAAPAHSERRDLCAGHGPLPVGEQQRSHGRPSRLAVLSYPSGGHLPAQS